MTVTADVLVGLWVAGFSLSLFGFVMSLGMGPE